MSTRPDAYQQDVVDQRRLRAIVGSSVRVAGGRMDNPSSESTSRDEAVLIFRLLARAVLRAYFQDRPQTPAYASQDVRVPRMRIPDQRLQQSNDARSDLSAWSMLSPHVVPYEPRVARLTRRSEKATQSPMYLDLPEKGGLWIGNGSRS